MLVRNWPSNRENLHKCYFLQIEDEKCKGQRDFLWSFWLEVFWENSHLIFIPFVRPDFMQVFASKKVYMFFYGVIGIINVRQFHISSLPNTGSNNKKVSPWPATRKFSQIYEKCGKKCKIYQMILWSQHLTMSAFFLLLGNAVHLPLHHVVNTGEEVWDQVQRNGEQATCGLSDKKSR